MPLTAEGLYSTNAICIGSLWCADRTLPRVMPTTNIAASNTAIAPSFRGGLSLPTCLSKSSWSYRFIFEVPNFYQCVTRQHCHCSTDREGTNIGFPDWCANPYAQWCAGHQFKQIKISISTELRRVRVCQSLDAVQPHVDRCVAQRPLGLSVASPKARKQGLSIAQTLSCDVVVCCCLSRDV